MYESFTKESKRNRACALCEWSEWDWPGCYVMECRVDGPRCDDQEEYGGYWPTVSYDDWCRHFQLDDSFEETESWDE